MTEHVKPNSKKISEIGVGKVKSAFADAKIGDEWLSEIRDAQKRIKALAIEVGINPDWWVVKRDGLLEEEVERRLLNREKLDKSELVWHLERVKGMLLWSWNLTGVSEEDIFSKMARSICRANKCLIQIVGFYFGCISEEDFGYNPEKKLGECLTRVKPVKQFDKYLDYDERTIVWWDDMDFEDNDCIGGEDVLRELRMSCDFYYEVDELLGHPESCKVKFG